MRPEVGNERTGNNTLLPEQTQNGSPLFLGDEPNCTKLHSQLLSVSSWACSPLWANDCSQQFLTLRSLRHISPFGKIFRFVFKAKNLNSLHPPTTTTSKNNLCVNPILKKNWRNSARLTDCKQLNRTAAETFRCGSRSAQCHFITTTNANSPFKVSLAWNMQMIGQ